MSCIVLGHTIQGLGKTLPLHLPGFGPPPSLPNSHPHTPTITRAPTPQVSVRVLGGLMALGYEIGTIMRRRSIIFKSADDELTVKLDEIENLGEFVQVGRGLGGEDGGCGPGVRATPLGDVSGFR